MTANKKQPPLAPGFPVLGNVLDLAKDTRAFLTAKYLELGPIYRVRALNQEFVVLAGTEANLFMTREGTNYFRSYEFWHGMDDELGAARSMISMDGPEHIRFRKVQQKGYGRTVIWQHIPEVIAITQNEMQQWPINEPLPGLYSLQRIITEQLGILAAGYSPREYLDDMIKFVRTALLTRVTKQRPDILRYTPSYRRARSRALELATNVHAVHQSETANEREPDLIDQVMQLAQEDSDFLPESDLMPAILGPFIAGLDTVASTCAFLLYILLTKPDILAMVQQEADALFRKGTPTPQDLRQMDITHRVIQETLRMYPIAPALQRTVTQDFEFAGYQVKAGDTVIIATTVPHYLPELYPDPERFDIERYTETRKEHKQPGAFAPFGLGAHTCLGAGWAEVQIMMTILTIVHSVDLVMDPPDYQLKIDPAPTPSPDKGFKIKLTGWRQPNATPDASGAQGQPNLK